MNKLNSKTTRIVSALALSAGLFSVSNSAMAASCQAETNLFYGGCTTGYADVINYTHKVTANATATDKINGRGVMGALHLFGNNGIALVRKDFVRSATISYTSSAIGIKYKAAVYNNNHNGRVTKLNASITSRRL